jgi:DNA processing protein
MKTWISLNMTPGVGPRVATKLLEAFGSADAVFEASRRELESLRLRPETVESIIKREFHDVASREIERVRALGGDVLLLDDGSFPFLLREIADPPIVLYVLGEWAKCFDAPGIGVIGSRQCSTYGQNAATMLARDLASNGICIISGLARGIDAAAHRGAVQAHGRTIAVIGTGIDAVYPRDNRRLVEEILASGGAVVSQFPLGTPPLRDNFPYRNRIISGLSYGVLLIEASERSGSLITARLATEQDREVLAVPGNITSRNSFGTNYLIKSGAKLVQQWQDVVAELPSEISAAILPPKMDPAKAPRHIDSKVPSGLSDCEKLVWRLLSTDEPRHLDWLLEETKLDFGQLNGALIRMSLNDFVTALPGNFYARRI